LEPNGLSVHEHHALAGQVFHPVLVQAVEDLRMHIQDSRMIERQLAVGMLTQGYGELFEGAQSGAVLEHHRHIHGRHRDGSWLLHHRSGWGRWGFPGHRRRRRFAGDWLRLRYRDWSGLGRFFLHLSQKAHLGAALGKGQDIAVLQKDFLDLLAVDEGPVGAEVDQLEAVAFANDFSMPARHNAEIRGKAQQRFRMSSDGYGLRRKLLDLSPQRTMQVYKLYDNHRRTFHMPLPSCPTLGA